MPHLTLEALARLVDEAPEAHEEMHLAGCEECQAELRALRDQTEALATLPALMPPPDAWPLLRHRMRGQGMIHDARPRWRGATATRIAAALALFVAGGTLGYAVRGVPEGGSAAVATVPTDTERTTPIAADRRTPSVDAGATTVALTEEVERTEEMFAAALDRFMQASGTAAPDPAARLAALDNIVLTTAEALNESPGDPVINSYHLTAVAQRNELIRQLVASGRPEF